MPDANQAPPPEHEISVDMNAADPEKAVSRTRADLGRAARGDEDADKGGRSKAEKDLYKRMTRLEKNLTRTFDQRMAEKDAEHQRQLSELQAKLAKVAVERGGDDAADQAHEQAISALKDQLAQAYEKGDSAASADITLKISKLDAQFWAKKAQAAGVVQREAPAAQVQPTQTQARSNGPTAAGSRFINANDDWWDDPEYAVEQSAANTIYLNLVQKEGFDPKSDETFNEVAKQMKAKFPNLDVRRGRRGPEEDEDPENDVEQHRNPRRPAAAARIEDRGQADARSRGSRRTLSPQDIATMRACRLDPDNDRDVVTFLREAVSLEQAS